MIQDIDDQEAEETAEDDLDNAEEIIEEFFASCEPDFQLPNDE